MSYLGYVIAAYTVFVLVMGWDYVSPRLQIRRELRAARRRAARQAAARIAATPDQTSASNGLTR